MIYLPRSAAALAAICAGGASRFSMESLRVSEYAEGFWRLDATDGKRLAVLRGPSMPHALDERMVESLPDESEEGDAIFQTLLPCTQFLTAMKGVPKASGRNTPERRLGVRLGEPILLWGGDSIVQARPVEGRFPDVDSVIPKIGSRVSVHLDAGYLIDLLKLAIEVTKGSDHERRVTLHYWLPGAPVAITTRGKDGVFLDAILMPMT